MKKMTILAMFLTVMVTATAVFAQEDGDGGGGDSEPAKVAASSGDSSESSDSDEGPAKQNFFAVIKASGPMGVFLWLVLFAAGGAAVYFTVDCIITVKANRIMPQVLVDNVTSAMEEGDILKALQCCENEPGPMANVLMAGFTHVEEGFDVIQESITVAADIETEKIMQKLTWLSVVGNLAPMLGLLGTVQGMIAAFSQLAGGAPDVGALALNISQALYTTAGGLVIAVPCVAVYYSFRNVANKIVLRMEAMTMELIKDLRNVEVVEE